jgi:hypothetical protein
MSAPVLGCRECGRLPSTPIPGRHAVTSVTIRFKTYEVTLHDVSRTNLREVIDALDDAAHGA